MFSLPLHVLLQITETLSNMAAIYYSPQGADTDHFLLFSWSSLSVFIQSADETPAHLASQNSKT